jgi:hypothetical protein
MLCFFLVWKERILWRDDRSIRNHCKMLIAITWLPISNLTRSKVKSRSFLYSSKVALQMECLLSKTHKTLKELPEPSVR